jgi:hypothetical protein
VGRVVKGPLQRGEDTCQHVAQAIDHPYPVGHKVGAVGGQQREIGGQLGGHVNRGKIAAVTGGLGND